MIPLLIVGIWENAGLLFNPDDFRLTRFQAQCKILFSRKCFSIQQIPDFRIFLNRKA